ncbi:hypothetical protein Taro_043521 [Colocasia esculenta]|uniref:YTH domain-containing family protein n=1 Tax=Colocasia esculenta TaxID=4460 RepID=A0A843WRM8_COLES|nr:hypothetical protein [Colocasia esculenta]
MVRSAGTGVEKSGSFWACLLPCAGAGIRGDFSWGSSSVIKMYSGSERVNAETYLIPGTNPNQQLVFTPTVPDIGSMGSEMTPEFIVDQGIYYSAAAPNYYGYYCTGFESPGESDDRHRFFGLDGQDLHGSEMQTESLPYVYFTPNYGFAHSPYSPYNPYNPYIPGAVIGVDSPFVGTPQLVTNVPYQQPVSSPAYFPVVVHSGADVIPNVASEPLVFNAVSSGAAVVDTLGIKFPPSATAAVISTMQQTDSLTGGPVLPRSPVRFHPSELSKPSQLDAVHMRQSSLQGTFASGGIPHIVQARDSRDPAGLVQASDQRKVETASSVPSSSKVTVLTYNGSNDFEPNMRGQAAMDGVTPVLINNGNGSMNMLGEQNRGPRTGGSKGTCASLMVKSYTVKAGACNTQGNITIYPDQFNREDFPVNYPDAKFFVIKSYSEDDVHKSIKYNVWSSTPSGNKRLDSAYEDAQRISGGDRRKCPVFLFFSVNTSGQFCGVAEMIGPVDFNRDMDFWQQDKWTGSFPVKWHIIKDVPNTSLRHIILENNENKPVTNSRDTQEIKYMPGMSMLTIFKNSPMKTSILDDFLYYEDRQRFMYEEKTRLLGGSYGSTLFVPAFAPPNKSSVTIKHPPKMEEKRVKPLNNVKSLDDPISVDDRVNSKSEHAAEANSRRSTALEGTGQDVDTSSLVTKIGSLSLDSAEGKASQSANALVSPEASKYVTVGSLPVKVNGYGGSPSGTLTVGTIPIHPKTVKEVP